MAITIGTLPSLIRLQPMGSHLTRSTTRTACTLPFLIPPPINPHHPTLLRRRLPLLSLSSPGLAGRCARGYSKHKRPKSPWGGGQSDLSAKKEGMGASVRAESQDEFIEQMTYMLFPHTFVPPTGENKPSFLKQTKLWWKFEWRKLKGWLLSPGIWIYMRYKYGVKLQKQAYIKSEAEALYRNMNSALAAGDINVLHQMCISSLSNQFHSEIHARPKNERLRWHFIRLVKPITIVSDISLPPDPNNPKRILRQVVTKITSLQSLTTLIRQPDSGQYVEESVPEPQIVTEYLVLYQANASEDIEWKVWGTTEETTPEGLKQIEYVEAKSKAGEELSVEQ